MASKDEKLTEIIKQFGCPFCGGTPGLDKPHICTDCEQEVVLPEFVTEKE